MNVTQGVPRLAHLGEDDVHRTRYAGAAIIQYTGLSEYSRGDVPTYACVGSSDGIAYWRTMQARLNGLASFGIPTEFYVYEGLPHGFGLGTGTVAEGWTDDAVRFWENQMKDSETTGIYLLCKIMKE